MGKGARNGSAFGLETGLVRTGEVVRLEPLAVDARTLCGLLGYQYATRTVQRLLERGMPQPISVSGEQRWILSEIRAWLPTCTRNTAKREAPGVVLDSGAAAQ